MTNRAREPWYAVIEPSKPLTQGDLLSDCPLVGWMSSELPTLDPGRESEVLRLATDLVIADVVVMTQACDLDQNKVDNVVLCPHFAIGEYKDLYEKELKRNSNNLTQKEWKNQCNRICNGHVWNLAMLNSNNTQELTAEHRVVDFHSVFTTPRRFLEALLVVRERDRPQLLAPYREHLSQAFARFFMRVGLPTPVAKSW